MILFKSVRLGMDIVVFAKRLRAHTKTEMRRSTSPLLWNSDLQKKLGGEETSISLHFANSLGALIDPQVDEQHY